MISKAIVRPIARAIARAINGGRAFTWTLGYNGVDVFGQLTNAIQLTGSDWEVRVTFFLKSPAVGDPYIFSNGDFATGNFLRARSTLDVIKKINGVQTQIQTDTDLSQYLTLSYSSADGDFINNAFSRIGAFSDGISDYLDGQVHLIEVINNAAPSESIRIDNRIQSALQPTDFAIYNTLTGFAIGTYSNGTYQPLLQGGGSAFDPEGYGSNVAGKSQQFNGDFAAGDYVLGVDSIRVSPQMSTRQSNGATGSWDSILIVGSILVANNGAVGKVNEVVVSDIIRFDMLLGLAANMQSGAEYPNVFRVLQDVGGTDNTDEYFYYNNSGSFPWTGS